MKTAGIKQSTIGAAYISIYSLLLNVISLPVTAYIIRKLGPDGYGSWSISLAFLGATGFVTNLGLRGTYIRNIVRTPDNASKTTADQLGIRFALGLLASVAALSLSMVMNYSSTIVICTLIAAISSLIGIFGSTIYDYLQATHQFRVIAGVGLISGLSLSTASVIFAWLNTGPIGIAFSYQVGPIVSAVLYLVILWKSNFRLTVNFDLQRSYKLLYDARYIASQQLIIAANTYAVSILLPKLSGTTLYGFYAAGILFVSRLEIIPDSIGSTYYTILAKVYNQSTKQFVSTACKGILISMFLCVIASITIYLCSPFISRILFHDKFAQCNRIIQITIWSLPISACASVLHYSYYSSNRESLQTLITIIFVIINLPLTVYMVFRWDIIGASWAYVITSFVRCALLGIYFVWIFMYKHKHENENTLATRPVA